MRSPRKALRAVAVAAMMVFAALLGAVPAGASAGGGWVRLAHLSPNAPAVDVYLYSFGNPQARLVLHHVSYGMVSPYEEVPAGDYTVSMRSAGAAASAQPLLSTGFRVSAGQAYTVAGMGPAAGLRLQVLKDTLTAPAGQVLIRVIQASLREHVVSVRLSGRMLAREAGLRQHHALPGGPRREHGRARGRGHRGRVPGHDAARRHDPHAGRARRRRPPAPHRPGGRGRQRHPARRAARPPAWAASRPGRPPPRFRGSP